MHPPGCAVAPVSGGIGTLSLLAFRGLFVAGGDGPGPVNRQGVRDYNFEVGYTHRPTDGFLRSIFAGVDAERIEVVGGGLQSQVVTLRALELESQIRDRASVRFYATKEVLTEPFIIWSKDFEQVIVPPGAYAFGEAAVSLSATNVRRVSGSFTYRSGDFFDGKRRNLSAGIAWRPSKHFQASLDYEFNDVELPQGEFTTRLVQFRTDIVFSTTMSWVTLVQYDNVTETMGVNTRFHWIPEAGREAFIVLNHNLEDVRRNDSFSSTVADLAVKFNYTFRF